MIGDKLLEEPKPKKPRFNNYKLEDIKDKNNKIPKLGDTIIFTLYDGIENVEKVIELDEFGYYKPYVLPYLEFEIIE